MTEPYTPAQIAFAKHLEQNETDLLSCRRFVAMSDAEALRDDPDLEVLFEMFFNGIGAAKDLTPLEIAEQLIDEYNEDETIEALMESFREEQAG